MGLNGPAGAPGVFCGHFVLVLGFILGLFAFVFSGPNCSAGYMFMKFSAANFQGFHVNFFSSLRLSKLFCGIYFDEVLCISFFSETRMRLLSFQ